MSDVVVTVPKTVWSEWLAEGALAYADDSMMAAGWHGSEVFGFVVGHRPSIELGERVYVVAHGRLRGYAPLLDFAPGERFGGRRGSVALVRGSGSVACTVGNGMRFDGFRGFRYRWWDRELEQPFAGWRTEGVR